MHTQLVGTLAALAMLMPVSLAAQTASQDEKLAYIRAHLNELDAEAIKQLVAHARLEFSSDRSADAAQSLAALNRLGELANQEDVDEEPRLIWRAAYEASQAPSLASGVQAEIATLNYIESLCLDFDPAPPLHRMSDEVMATQDSLATSIREAIDSGKLPRNESTRLPVLVTRYLATRGSGATFTYAKDPENRQDRVSLIVRVLVVAGKANLAKRIVILNEPQSGKRADPDARIDGILVEAEYESGNSTVRTRALFEEARQAAGGIAADDRRFEITSFIDGM